MGGGREEETEREGETEAGRMSRKNTGKRNQIKGRIDKYEWNDEEIPWQEPPMNMLYVMSLPSVSPC